MNNPIDNISVDDLKRLSRCLITSFGQVIDNTTGELLSGETDEENKRLAEMYDSIGQYLHKESGGEIVTTYSVVKQYVDKKINQTKQ